MRAGARVAVASGALLLAACVHPAAVERAYGGNVVQGRYVSPEGYAWFLRGALAAAAHRTEEAVTAYQRAASLDPASPEPWARIAVVLCDAGEREGRARAAIERALSLDPEAPGSWAARARCAGVHGDAREQHDAAAHASALGDSTPLV
ncbi:MAG TPA: tetratricopeptide repeat protein, partial [Polyangiaceae bacterium]